MVRRNYLFVAAVCLAGLLPILSHAADEKGAAKTANGDSKPAATRLANRLPPHYGKLVDQTQRTKIYEIQAKYAEKIEDLQEQLKEVMLQRDAEIRGVLTEEQQKKLDELLATVRGKMKAGKKSADDKEAAPKTGESAKK